MPEVKPIEPPKTQPPPEKEVVVVPAKSKQLMGQPPVTIKEFYPEKGSGLGYRGYVSIAATIGKVNILNELKEFVEAFIDSSLRVFSLSLESYERSHHFFRPLVVISLLDVLAATANKNYS